MRKHLFVTAALASTCAAPLALAGPDWVELLDAGGFISNAQEISINSQLQTVTGSLTGTAFGGVDFEDCFLFNITNPTTFQITTSGPQVQLSLFRIENDGKSVQAFGLLANTNGPATAQLTQFATDFTEAFVDQPGTYMLGISLEGRVPGNFEGNIFSFANPTEISGPDGPGGDYSLQQWFGTPSGGGSYMMSLSGSAGTTIPAPGAAMLLAGGLACASRRRRR